MPSQPRGPETTGPAVSPDQFSGLSPERPAAPEMAPAASSAPQSAQVTPPPKLSPADVAAAIAAVPGPTGPGMPAAATPAQADDVDVIEPEWVAKAEEVVAAHQGDPYGEEEAIEHLQQDYLQKRYGHTVGDPNSDGRKHEGA
jgi:hypothetical protein